MSTPLGLTNGGILSISNNSTLILQGNYTQQPGDILQITLDAADTVNDDDRLEVLGTASLGGTLDTILAGVHSERRRRVRPADVRLDQR